MPNLHDHFSTICSRIALAVVLCGAAAGFCSASKAEDDRITWAVFEAAPFNMTAGADADQGIFDLVRLLLQRHLEGYSFATSNMPFPRALAGIQNGLHWCYIGGIRTPEREAFAAFSLPVAMEYPLGIVVHANRRESFAALEPLSVQRLAQDTRLRTSVLRNRSFGPEIDAILRRAAAVNSQIDIVHGFSEFGEAYRMLLADRLDYIIDFAAIANYTGIRMGRSDEVVVLPVTDEPPPTINRVMCPNNAWGRRVVASIDAILRTERSTEDYRRIVEHWSDATAVRELRRYYDSVFLKIE